MISVSGLAWTESNSRARSGLRVDDLGRATAHLGQVQAWCGHVQKLEESSWFSNKNQT